MFISSFLNIFHADYKIQLLGLGLLTCGIWAWTEKGFFDDIADQTEIPLDPVVLIISIGFVMFILSFAGCLGSLRENICLLKFVSESEILAYSGHFFRFDLIFAHLYLQLWPDNCP